MLGRLIREYTCRQVSGMLLLEGECFFTRDRDYWEGNKRPGEKTSADTHIRIQRRPGCAAHVLHSESESCAAHVLQGCAAHVVLVVLRMFYTLNHFLPRNRASCTTESDYARMTLLLLRVITRAWLCCSWDDLFFKADTELAEGHRRGKPTCMTS